jgi:hypothetical protein
MNLIIKEPSLFEALDHIHAFLVFNPAFFIKVFQDVADLKTFNILLYLFAVFLFFLIQ